MLRSSARILRFNTARPRLCGAYVGIPPGGAGPLPTTLPSTYGRRTFVSSSIAAMGGRSDSSSKPWKRSTKGKQMAVAEAGNDDVLSALIQAVNGDGGGSGGTASSGVAEPKAGVKERKSRRRKVVNSVDPLSDLSPPFPPVVLPPSDPPPVSLRPYQTQAIDACLAALSRGRRRIGVSSPTGSGKTTMFMHLIPRIPAVDALDQVAPHVTKPAGAVEVEEEEVEAEVKEEKREAEEVAALGQGGGPGEGQTLILVGSIELAEQSRAAARRILGAGWSVELEQGKHVASGFADVTVATYQTLSNAIRLRKFNPARFKLVIVDEAHHAAARSYLRLLHYFNAGVALPPDTEPYDTLEEGADVPIVGFSATFSRHDTLALSAAFEKIVFHRDVGYMLEEGWLAPVKSTAVYADLQLEDVERTQSGEYATASLARHVNTPAVNMLVVRTYLHRASDRRSTLVFAVNLQHVSDLVHAFRHAGVDARSVTSATSAGVRRDVMEAFRHGDFPVLVNCEVLTEGADVPELDCVILARPTRSKNLLAQMVGRGLRLSPATGKTDCYLIDIADNISRASGMLVAPTLFGLTHDDVAEERAKMEEKMGSAAGATPRPPDIAPPSQIKMIDSSDPFGLASPSLQTHHIPKLSTLAWVHCGGGRHVLELMGGGFVTIEPVEGKWSVTMTPKLPSFQDGAPRRGSPFARVQQIAFAEDAERAVRTADAYVERRVPRDLLKSLSRYAPWRARPASPKQLQLMLKLKGIKPDPEEESNPEIKGPTIMVGGRVMDPKTLTGGQVAALLCAAQHGGLTTRRKAEERAASAQAKVERAAQKERAHAERNLQLPGL